MTANQIWIVLLAFIAIASFSLAILSLRLGLKWAKIAEISVWRTLGLFLVIWVSASVLSICVGLVAVLAHVDVSDLADFAVGYGMNFIASSLVIAIVYHVNLKRAALASIPSLAAGLAILCFIFAMRAYAYEAFVIPTNAMAPTLLGTHCEAACPRCGQPAYGSRPAQSDPPGSPASQMPSEGLMMVCSKEMTPVAVHTAPRKYGEGDRIVACKLLRPKRWDLVVFRPPVDPTVCYVKRLVGLPGEKLEIRDGAVWINGEKLEPPESIRGIQYSPTVEWHGESYSGPGSQPVQLGADEYFVLGDFVNFSSDSRLWEHGAPGHAPYAVPKSNIVGVVINIYWPVSRWKSFK